MNRRKIKLITILAVLMTLCYIVLFACPNLIKILVNPNPACVGDTVKFSLQLGALDADSASFTFTKIQYELTDPNGIKTTLTGDANTLAEYKTEIVGEWKIKLTAAEGDLVKNNGKTFKKIYTQSEYPAVETFLVVGVDLDIGSVTEDDEESKGGYLCLNDDDDNSNSQMDKDESGTVSGENDLIELKLKLDPSALSTGTLKLEATAGNSKVKVWKTASKNTEVALPKTWTVGTDAIPTTLYLEGVAGSDSERDVTLLLTYTHDTISCSDTIKATIVAMDLDVGNVTDNDEETKGDYLCLNDNDDNNNSQMDKDESGTVAGEKDLIKLKLKLDPSSLSTGALKLEATAGGSKVKVWENATKGTEVVLPKTWTVGTDTIPKKLYLEGVVGSNTERDVTLKLSYTFGSIICEDKIKATIISVEKVEVHSSDTDTHKITANSGAAHNDHFVCALNTGEIILDAKLLPNESTSITDLITWEATGAAIISPAVGTDKTTAKLPSGTSLRIPVRLKVNGKKCWEGLVWVVFANVTLAAKADSITSTATSLTIAMGYNFTHTLTPSTIITDSDRPDLSGVNTSPVPPAGGLNHAGVALTGGANKKWDSSRQIRKKFINPSLIPLASIPGGASFHTDFLSFPSLADGDGRPGGAGAISAEDLAVVGNDDSGVGDETNDPYTGSTGKLLGEDAPTRIMLHNVGADGDTVEWRLQFFEFTRLNLGTKWYRISNDYNWKVHYKMKKVAGKWVNDNSLKATDNAGF